MIVFGRRGYKSYQLMPICWLATGPLRLVGLVGQDGWLMCLLMAGTEAC